MHASQRRRPSDAHPLLGVRHESPRGEVMFETEMSPSDPAWLQDHQVFGRVVMPGGLYGAMAASASLTGGVGPAIVEELQLHSPLVFPEQNGESEAEASDRRVQLVLDNAKGSEPRRFEIFSKGPAEEGWTLHAEGRLASDLGRLDAQERADLDSLKANLEPQDLGAYYQAKAATGIDFGPHFRSLEALWGRTGEALGEVVLRETGEASGQTVHPLLLDGCFQVLSAARNLAGIGSDATYLPFGWERLWLKGPLPERFICHARIRQTAQGDGLEAAAQPPETLTGDLWLYTLQGVALGELSGFAVKRATRSSLLSASEGLQDMLYEVVWRDRPLPGGLQSAEALTGPAAVREGMSPFADYLSREGVELDDRAALLSDLERLSRSYSLAALEQLGWQRRQGEAAAPSALCNLLQVDPQHTQFLGRLLRLLRDGGVLEDTADGGYTVAVGIGDPLPDEALIDPETFADKTAERYSHGHNELGLVRRSGNALADGLRGTVDILEILFRSEGPGVTEYYFSAPASRASNRLLGDAVAQAVRNWPDGRRLRVLEVGAGTGSATSVVLPELPAGQVDYMFTDISAGFFAEAERRFSDSGIPIEYRPLDIEKHPTNQGFELHSYDLIIAANVLHATRDLGETLSHCRELLAPSGQLIALENMRGRGWQDITFGLLDGWWRFADDYRPHHAMTSPSVWLQALTDSGYEEVDFLGVERAEEDGPLGSSVILAQGPAKITEPPGLWVISGGEVGVAKELAAQMASRNQRVVLANDEGLRDGIPTAAGQNLLTAAVNTVSRESWRSLLEGLPRDMPFSGVVHLQGLEGHGTQATTGELEDDVRRAGASALALVQGLLDADVAPEKGLWFVTLGVAGLGAGLHARMRRGACRGGAVGFRQSGGAGSRPTWRANGGP